jgi:hypothetical protein
MTRLAAARLLLAALAAALVPLGAAACGGAEPSTPAETSGEQAATHERLSRRQAVGYEAAAAELDRASERAARRLGACASDDLDLFFRCFSAPLTDLQVATAELLRALESARGAVTGACARSLDALARETEPYAGAAQALEDALRGGEAAAFPGARRDLGDVLGSGLEGTAAVERDCLPD